MKLQSCTIVLTSHVAISNIVGAMPPLFKQANCPFVPDGLGEPNTKLNDPFRFHHGDPVTDMTTWQCRHDEISGLLQKYELGQLPANPEKVSATYSENMLSIQVSDGDKSVTFTVTISNHDGGTEVPAIINFGTFGPSIPIPSGVAVIAFNNDDIAQQNGASSRGEGKFYDLYGTNHSAGALTAWAWGVSRVLDALEQTKSQTGLDPTRIGVTGCSRNGKGAMVAGALEPRIALTLPQESGSGGAGCWRLETWMNANGYTVQDAQEIVGENVWFGTTLNAFVNDVDQLPFDHHMLAGLVAPRAMYIMENPDYEWLGSMSTFGCMGAARKIYSALGKLDSFGYSQVGGHSHCAFPVAQQDELDAFIRRFLLGEKATTGVFRTDQTYSGFNIDDWSPWEVPNLV